MMIIGVGVDLVDVARFERTISKNPNVLERLFVSSELQNSGESSDARVRSLAGKFAAKEAFVKAMRGAEGLHWHEVVLEKTAEGAPVFVVSGESANVIEALGVRQVHVSISHDAGAAMAFVVAEGGE